MTSRRAKQKTPSLNFVFEEYGPYFAVLGSIGDRPQMEDAFSTLSNIPDLKSPNIFSVFDGHGGQKCAHFCRDALNETLSRHPDLKRNPKRAIRESFLEVDSQYCKLAQQYEDLDDGTTACLLYVAPVLNSNSATQALQSDRKNHAFPAPSNFPGSESKEGMTGRDSSRDKPGKERADSRSLVDKRLKFYLAWVGDSRAILVKKNGTAVPLSFDHDLERRDEVTRIERAGGKIRRDDFGARVVSDSVGELSVTRAIGDADFKQAGVIADPEIEEGFLDDSCAFIIMASDGLWGQMSNEEVGRLLTKDSRFPPGTKLAKMVEELVRISKRRDNQQSIQFYEELSCDNITILGINIPAMIERISKRSEAILQHQMLVKEKQAQENKERQLAKLKMRKNTLIINGLTPHGYTADLLLWKNPTRSALWLVSGCLFYFLTQIAGYSFLTLTSYLLLSQLVINSFVVNFAPLLRRLSFVDDSFDSVVFLSEGTFITEEVVDRAANLVHKFCDTVFARWRMIVYEASPQRVLVAMRNISYFFTPLTLPNMLFIGYLSLFSVVVTYEKNKDMIDKLYHRMVTMCYRLFEKVKLR